MTNQLPPINFHVGCCMTYDMPDNIGRIPGRSPVLVMVAQPGDVCAICTQPIEAESGMATTYPLGLLPLDAELERLIHEEEEIERLTRGTYRDAGIPDAVAEVACWFDTKPELELDPSVALDLAIAQGFAHQYDRCFVYGPDCAECTAEEAQYDRQMEGDPF